MANDPVIDRLLALAERGRLSPDLEAVLKRYIIAKTVAIECDVRESVARTAEMNLQMINDRQNEFARREGYRDYDDYYRRYLSKLF